MGSLSLPPRSKNDSLIITQVSIAGFDPKTTASFLASSLERILNCVIWRCRLKLSSPPPDSYPNFDLDLDHQLPSRSSSRPPSAVIPHAFLQFATPAGAQRALDLSSRCELLLDGKPLTVLSSPQSSSCVSGRQSTRPFSFPDAILSIGSLTGESLFFSAARVAPVLFLVDPFDSSCKFFFSRDLGFSVRGSKEVEIIKCDLKLEFLIRDVMEVKTYNEGACLVLMLQLTLNSAPLIYYRTADDDIHYTFWTMRTPGLGARIAPPMGRSGGARVLR